MIIICGKTYYNLEEAVNRLTQLIGRTTDVVKNIVGQVDQASDLPDSTSVNIGSTYAVGTASPYNYYVALAAGWLDMGTFPMQGDPGTDGIDGHSIWYSVDESTTTLSSVTVNSIYNPDDYAIQSGDLLITAAGDLYSITAVASDYVTVSYRMQLKGEKGDTGGTVFELEDLTAAAMPDYETAAAADTAIIYGARVYRQVTNNETEIIYTAAYTGGIVSLVLTYNATSHAAVSVTYSINRVQSLIRNVELLGTVTGVTYDTEDGISATGSGAIVNANGDTENINATVNMPIFPGDNVTIDANEGGNGIVINAAGGSATVFELTGLTADAMPDYETASANTIIHYGDYFYTFAGEEYDEGGAVTITYFAVLTSTSTAIYASQITMHYSPTTFAAISASSVNGWIGARAITPSGATAAATSGTLTASEYSNLISSDANYILFNNECYYLADKQHTTGILTYAHTGYNGDTGTIKYFNITVSTKAWTLTSYTPSGGTSGTIPVVESIDNPTSTSDTLAQYNGAIYCLVEE